LELGDERLPGHRPDEGVFMSDTLPPLDPTLDEAAAQLGITLRPTYRLIKAGEIVSYILAGKRRLTADSIRRYRERQIAKGPQLLFSTEKRPPGRPRKYPKPEAQPPAASRQRR
jgi:excisionase family DNA binding protein